MRILLVLIGLLALAAVVLLSIGMLRVEFPKEGMMPRVRFDVQAGRLPEVKTGTIEMGTTNATFAVPTVEMRNTTVSLPTIEVKKAPAESAPPAEKK
ncbi:hypothetical protein ACFQ1E_14780 [Sphingomonas canadensis]|uniref:AsmA family protein n=1 Tax=Sphingomonas canadensis TaxID=1219257 RepID=A0ABW3H9X1_9SPHN|nr:hypothetical protein [Sphingomonas canadensis]MCW3837150.1 hypothetical protein [Sphingomonas canadensis]